MKNTWVVLIEADGDDLVLPLPQELLELMQWQPGDVLEWIEQPDGNWHLRKKDNECSSLHNGI